VDAQLDLNTFPTIHSSPNYQVMARNTPALFSVVTEQPHAACQLKTLADNYVLDWFILHDLYGRSGVADDLAKDRKDNTDMGDAPVAYIFPHRMANKNSPAKPKRVLSLPFYYEARTLQDYEKPIDRLNYTMEYQGVHTIVARAEHASSVTYMFYRQRVADFGEVSYETFFTFKDSKLFKSEEDGDQISIKNGYPEYYFLSQAEAVSALRQAKSFPCDQEARDFAINKVFENLKQTHKLLSDYIHINVDYLGNESEQLRFGQRPRNLVWPGPGGFGPGTRTVLQPEVLNSQPIPLLAHYVSNTQNMQLPLNAAVLPLVIPGTIPTPTSTFDNKEYAYALLEWTNVNAGIGGYYPGALNEDRDKAIESALRKWSEKTPLPKGLIRWELYLNDGTRLHGEFKTGETWSDADVFRAVSLTFALVALAAMVLLPATSILAGYAVMALFAGSSVTGLIGELSDWEDCLKRGINDPSKNAINAALMASFFVGGLWSVVSMVRLPIAAQAYRLGQTTLQTDAGWYIALAVDPVAASATAASWLVDAGAFFVIAEKEYEKLKIILDDPSKDDATKFREVGAAIIMMAVMGTLLITALPQVAQFNAARRKPPDQSQAPPIAEEALPEQIRVDFNALIAGKGDEYATAVEKSKQRFETISNEQQVPKLIIGDNDILLREILKRLNGKKVDAPYSVVVNNTVFYKTMLIQRGHGHLPRLVFQFNSLKRTRQMTNKLPRRKIEISPTPRIKPLAEFVSDLTNLTIVKKYTSLMTKHSGNNAKLWVDLKNNLKMTDSELENVNVIYFIKDTRSNELLKVGITDGLSVRHGQYTRTARRVKGNPENGRDIEMEIVIVEGLNQKTLEHFESKIRQKLVDENFPLYWDNSKINGKPRLGRPGPGTPGQPTEGWMINPATGKKEKWYWNYIDEKIQFGDGPIYYKDKDGNDITVIELEDRQYA